MNRIAAIAIGFTLVLLGIIGFATDAATWLSAAALVGGAWSFLTLALVRPNERGNIAVAWPSVLAMALLVIGLSAVTAQATTWLTVATFVVGGCCVLEAIAARPGGFGHRAHLPR
jgi:hypothetical protein